MFDQRQEYRRMATDLVQRGKTGDMGTTEIINYNYQIDPRDPWFSLTDRKLNTQFIMKELIWYLDGDPAAAWIGDHAGVWKSVLDHDKRAVSNYGMEAFRHRGLQRVVHLLRNEPMTRRAIIYFGMNAYVRKHSETKDQPCANSIHFMVRDGVLRTIVSQRSQDFIYGVAGDAVFMAMLTMLVASALEVHMDLIDVQVASFHHYPKHTDMVNRLQTSNDYQIDWIYGLKPWDAEQIMIHGMNAENDYTRWVFEGSGLT